MLICMRTTIDIPDELALKAKKVALERRTTLRELVLRGLKCVLAGPLKPQKSEPIDRLEGLGKEIWRDIDADAYVREQRQGWE